MGARRGYLLSQPIIQAEGPRTYSHPEVDRIWGIQGIHRGSFKDHVILSTPG